MKIKIDYDKIFYDYSLGILIFCVWYKLNLLI